MARQYGPSRFSLLCHEAIDKRLEGARDFLLGIVLRRAALLFELASLGVELTDALTECLAFFLQAIPIRRKRGGMNRPAPFEESICNFAGIGTLVCLETRNLGAARLSITDSGFDLIKISESRLQAFLLG